MSKEGVDDNTPITLENAVDRLVFLHREAITIDEDIKAVVQEIKDAGLKHVVINQAAKLIANEKYADWRTKMSNIAEVLNTVGK